MTSLIDVIFLLLLFFMLTSTFSKFLEVELSTSGAGTVAQNDSPPMFLQLTPQDLRLNGTVVAMAALQSPALGEATKDATLIINLSGEVHA